MGGQKWKKLICDKVSVCTSNHSLITCFMIDSGRGAPASWLVGSWHVGLTPDGYGTRDIPTRII